MAKVGPARLVDERCLRLNRLQSITALRFPTESRDAANSRLLDSIGMQEIKIKFLLVVTEITVTAFDSEKAEKKIYLI